jgi:hypothetical protein
MSTKNLSKGDSFTYAYKRINHAIDQEFYLEAVTLCESIISDRLYSFIKYKKSIQNNNKILQNKNSRHIKQLGSLKSLIDNAKKLNSLEITTKDGIDFFDALDQWRSVRNKCIHSVAKSEPGEPTISVEDFKKIAKSTALDGKYLARLVCNWRRKI